MVAMKAPVRQFSSHISTPYVTTSMPRRPQPSVLPPARLSLSDVTRKSSPRVSSRQKSSLNGPARVEVTARTRIDVNNVKVPTRSRTDARAKNPTRLAFLCSRESHRQRFYPLGLRSPCP